MQDFCIIANGPNLSKKFIINAASAKQILALDGAANLLFKYSIKPDIILGDFDSINFAVQNYFGIKPINTISNPYFGKQDVLIVPTFDQNYTDLEKAVQYCDSEYAKNIIIIGATGGREDHHEALKIVIKQNYSKLRKIVVHSKYGTMCYVEDETVNFHGKKGDYCGFILQNQGLVISEGLAYQCAGYTHSISNRMLGELASFEVVGGALLFLPLQLPKVG